MIIGKIGNKKLFYSVLFTLNLFIVLIIWLIFVLNGTFNSKNNLSLNVISAMFIQILLTCGLGGPFLYKGYLKSHGIDTKLPEEEIKQLIKINNASFEKTKKIKNKPMVKIIRKENHQRQRD